MGRDYPATLAPGVQGKFAACSSRLAAPWLPVGAQVSRLALLHTSPGAQKAEGTGNRRTRVGFLRALCPAYPLYPVFQTPGPHSMD